eukprot:TRINITY_DN13197_c0_g1_i1.p1 TRINITY_DN13197_c0_g1~~TRINITY_DN13197_c0_g1_i1.p1  ORF type:complete len:364 (+),score=95.34 TRINITY_DN13197_c0_g1_i1:98-1093(+)
MVQPRCLGDARQLFQTPLLADAVSPGFSDDEDCEPFALYAAYDPCEAGLPWDDASPGGGRLPPLAPGKLHSKESATLGFDPLWLNRTTVHSARMELFEIAASPVAQAELRRRKEHDAGRIVPVLQIAEQCEPWLGCLPPTLRERSDVVARRAAEHRAGEVRRRNMQTMQEAARPLPLPPAEPRRFAGQRSAGRRPQRRSPLHSGGPNGAAAGGMLSLPGIKSRHIPFNGVQRQSPRRVERMHLPPVCPALPTPRQLDRSGDGGAELAGLAACQHGPTHYKRSMAPAGSPHRARLVQAPGRLAPLAGTGRGAADDVVFELSATVSSPSRKRK